MDITIPLFPEICLKIGPVTINGDSYPTSRLQKGLILISNGQELAEEGVGFGVPVLKMGVKTIFPGGIELAFLDEGSRQEISAKYILNLEERITSHGFRSLKSKQLYQIKNHLADLYRRSPPARGPLLVISNALRRSFGWQTTYEDAGGSHAVMVSYTVDCHTGIIAVAVDAVGLEEVGITELILMNEQGAYYFDRYSDSSGLELKGEEIGSWNEVTAERASFLSSTQRLAFTLQQIKGARLFRGREYIGSRLAWSGFGYSIPPRSERFSYTLSIERPP